MNCKGLHCQGCGHGGGAAGAVIALVVIAALALRKAWPAVVAAVEVAAWTVAGVSGATLVITAGVLTTKEMRRCRARRELARRPAYRYVLVVDEAPRTFTGTLPPAPGQIEPPRWPLAGPDLRPWIGGDGDERRPR